MIGRCVSLIVVIWLLVCKNATGFCFNRMMSSSISRRFAISDGVEPPTQRKNTVKTLHFNDVNELGEITRSSMIFSTDKQFQSFLKYFDAFGVEDTEGNRHRSLELIDVDKEYTLCRGGKAAERFDGFITNSAKAFEAKANVAVVNALKEMGQQSVELRYAAKEVSHVESKDVKGEFDGIVVTASHLFVVEAKLHAKVVLLILEPTTTTNSLIHSPTHSHSMSVSQSPDLYGVLRNVNLINDPKVQPPLFDADDPRRKHVVGVLATSSVPDPELVEAARSFGVWLLALDGSGFSLTPSTK